jgi:phosphoribosylglycinamide formyltransferase 1
MSRPKILVYASGSKDGGGSGFEKLFDATQGESPALQAEVVAVVSNIGDGGVKERADRLKVPFIHFPGEFTAEQYQQIAEHSGADFFALSGWLKLVRGLDPKTRFNSRTVFNIHPGPLPDFGGKNMHGSHVHEAVVEAYEKGIRTHSAVTMHFVTDEYDQGPVFFRHHVPIMHGDSAKSLGDRVNKVEHEWQPAITNLVVNGQITWDGLDPASLILPPDYQVDHYKLYWDRNKTA